MTNPIEKRTISWTWQNFDELSTNALYRIISARESVFVVEQKCPYLECDGLDIYAWHLAAWANRDETEALVAYLRVIQPGKKNAGPTIGRVLTTKAFRHCGTGRELIRRGIENTKRLYPNHSITISAQEYLKRFYQDYGFKQTSEIYYEDGIQHIDMIL